MLCPGNAVPGLMVNLASACRISVPTFRVRGWSAAFPSVAARGARVCRTAHSAHLQRPALRGLCRGQSATTSEHTARTTVAGTMVDRSARLRETAFITIPSVK